MNAKKIKIVGAKIHNLKNISVEIPKNKLIVITGPSGSGKSSLAYDTIYAEGHRRYVESLSAYARQFLGMMNRADVEHIEGLSPAISVDQKTTLKNPRSTVGTITEIYDYLRLLYGNLGEVFCIYCGRKLKKFSPQEIVESIMGFEPGRRFLVLSPIVRGKKGEHRDLIYEVFKKGFARVRVDGEIYTNGEVKLDKNKKHNIEIVVDRVVLDKNIYGRLLDSVELALKEGDGVVIFYDVDKKEEIVFSENFGCPIHGFSIGELSPRIFSFNSPYGACKKCSGLGVLPKIDVSLLVDEEKNVLNSIPIVKKFHFKYLKRYLKILLSTFKISENTKFKDLPEDIKEMILYGFFANRYGLRNFSLPGGIVGFLEKKFKESENEKMREEIKKYIQEVTCPECNGKRLSKEVLSVKISGKDISQLSDMNITTLKTFLMDYLNGLSGARHEIGKKIIDEIVRRLSFIEEIGLTYLTLSRNATTLSGGEAQRIRLATQIGSKLTGVLYVLEEPSIGLHPRDTKRLIKSLKNLRNLGNTVIVVEHDLETIRSADYIVDMGPGSGANGGEIVAKGTLNQIVRSKKSITGKYLKRHNVKIFPRKREKVENFLEIVGAREHNLKSINVKFPLGRFNVVTGVSGSGKSSLIFDILWKYAQKKFYRTNVKYGEFDEIRGFENIDKVINIDQSPIGRTPRSNPATYTKIFDYIREIFSNTFEARVRGYKSGRFSFNVKGGRCEVCEGGGIVKIEMMFLPDMYVVCDACGGKRYNKETLSIHYRGKNIYDVLDMSIDEAYSFFDSFSSLKRRLSILRDVGLGYLKLGQPATTLSGGEAQRLKISRELSKRDTGSTLYLLDEPTTGLHTCEVEKLVEVLLKLVEKGNTVILIEHNLDVIANTDWIVDLGPEGGNEGGYVVYQGPIEGIFNSKDSYTAKFLKDFIG